MKLVFATGNNNKVQEIRSVLPAEIELVGLKDLGITEEIPEDHDTLEQNAVQKAMYVFKRTGSPCFADDTGLEVDALNGSPGVRSARYAGEEKNAAANMAKVLQELLGIQNRNASFKTVIAYITDHGQWLFEGKVKGRILDAPGGEEGFGYDPIFQPEGEERSFAQMSLVEKNTMSHRAHAVKKFIEFLIQDQGANS